MQKVVSAGVLRRIFLCPRMSLLTQLSTTISNKNKQDLFINPIQPSTFWTFNTQGGADLPPSFFLSSWRVSLAESGVSSGLVLQPVVTSETHVSYIICIEFVFAGWYICICKMEQKVASGRRSCNQGRPCNSLTWVSLLDDKLRPQDAKNRKNANTKKYKYTNR